MADKKQTSAKSKNAKSNSKSSVTDYNYVGFYKTNTAKSLTFIVGVIMTYVFVSLAIDSGSLWHYLFAFIAIYLSIKSLVDLVRPKFK